MAKRTVRQIIKQANVEQWDTENVFAVYCTAWAGGPLKRESGKVQLIGDYDKCVDLLKSTPQDVMPLAMVELAEGYTLRTNFRPAI